LTEIRKVLVFVLLLAAATAGVPTGSFAHEVSRRSAVVEVVEKVAPAVVNIRTEQIVRRRGSPVFGFGDDFFDSFFRGYSLPRVYKTQSLGSGVIIDPRGYVLTNAHVVEQASKIYVAIAGEKREIEASLVGLHERLDLAVIKINATASFTAVTLGRSNDLLLGETVIAIGNPLGLGSSVTTGVISSVQRRVELADNLVGHFLQTDALINPGNSGGPLLNIAGELIGINTAIASQAQGIGFAIPIDLAKGIAGDLIRYGKLRQPWLGVLPGTVGRAMVEARGVGGALVTEVDAGSPAEKAGLQVADVVLAIDGTEIETPEELMQLVDAYTPDNSLRLRLLRGTRELEVTARLAPLPADYGLDYARRVFGFVLQDGDGGPVIRQVLAGTPAEKVGLHNGDRLLEIEGVEVKNRAEADRQFTAHYGRLPLGMLIVRDKRAYGLTLP